MKRSVVLLSAGLDSTVNLYLAKKESEVALALTFDYGQRAAEREIAQAREIAKLCGVRHQALHLPWFEEFTQTSLVNRKSEVPKDVELDSQGETANSAQKVWVPNRNGIFLNIAAAFAEGLSASEVVPGFNLEEAQTFPDNSQGFIDTLNASLHYSTANHVKVVCYTTKLDKTSIVEKAIELKINFAKMWPCYFGGEKWCLKCESCQRFQRALKNCGIDASGVNS